MKTSKKYFFLSALLALPVTVVFLQVTNTPQYQSGKKVYQQYCLSCHMNDGNGVPGLNPPLIKTEWVTGDKKRLINIILKGFNQEVEINGEVYANPMPAQPQLNDQQIADVLTYVRNSFGNKSSAITAAEVKAVRAAK